MKKIIHIVSVYSILHFIVDFATIALVVAVIGPTITGMFNLLVGITLYNFFAFALQLPIGIIADKLNKNALLSAIGCGFVILAYLVLPLNMLACILAGIGNALFHVGGGIDILNISKKKASLLGIYVAPGTFGVFLGTVILRYGINKTYIIASLIASIVALLHLYRSNKLEYKINNKEPVLISFDSKKIIIMLCLLFTICIRGYMGFILNFSWKSQFNLALIFVLGIIAGKALGGIFADRFGLMKTAVVSLSLSSVLFIFSFNNPVLGICAIFFFNMTMPITLIILSNIFDNNKGFAFGLTTLALFIGSIPAYLKLEYIFFNPIGIFSIVVFSATTLYIGIKIYRSGNKVYDRKFNNKLGVNINN